MNVDKLINTAAKSLGILSVVKKVNRTANFIKTISVLMAAAVVLTSIVGVIKK